MGVRISWLMLARNSDFDLFEASAASFALIRFRSAVFRPVTSCTVSTAPRMSLSGPAIRAAEKVSHLPFSPHGGEEIGEHADLQHVLDAAFRLVDIGYGLVVMIQEQVAQAGPFVLVERLPVVAAVPDILLGNAGQLLDGRVPMQDPVVPVDEKHGDRGPVDHGIQLPLAVLQPLFGQLPGSDVLVGTDGLDGHTPLVPDQPVADHHVSFLAVATDDSVLQIDLEEGVAGGEQLLQRIVDQTHVVGVHELPGIGLGGHAAAAFLGGGCAIEGVEPVVEGEDVGGQVHLPRRHFRKVQDKIHLGLPDSQFMGFLGIEKRAGMDDLKLPDCLPGSIQLLGEAFITGKKLLVGRFVFVSHGVSFYPCGSPVSLHRSIECHIFQLEHCRITVSSPKKHTFTPRGGPFFARVPDAVRGGVRPWSRAKGARPPSRRARASVRRPGNGLPGPGTPGHPACAGGSGCTAP